MTDKRFILVTGPESSGSRLIARTIATAIGICKYDDWDGHGDAHDDLNHVMHRSLPYNDPPNWIDTDAIKSKHNVKENFHLVICTRDMHIVKRSKVFRFIKSDKIIELESRKAKEFITKNLGEQTFIWSYETFMFLRESYLQRLYQFLHIESNFMPTIADGNQKYIKDFQSLKDRIKVFIKRIGA